MHVVHRPKDHIKVISTSTDDIVGDHSNRTVSGGHHGEAGAN